MKVSDDGDRVTVSMNKKEAYKVFNFVEYASRDSMDWTAPDTFGGTMRLRGTWGRNKAKRLAELLDGFDIA